MLWRGRRTPSGRIKRKIRIPSTRDAAGVLHADLIGEASDYHEEVACRLPLLDVHSHDLRAVQWNLPFCARLGVVELPRHRLRAELTAVVAEEASRGHGLASFCPCRHQKI